MVLSECPASWSAGKQQLFHSQVFSFARHLRATDQPTWRGELIQKLACKLPELVGCIGGVVSVIIVRHGDGQNGRGLLKVDLGVEQLEGLTSLGVSKADHMG